MRIEALAARLLALRALAAFAVLLLLCVALVGGASAELLNPIELRPAPRAGAGDGLLHVQMDAAGEAATLLSPQLAWRLEITGHAGLPYREGYIFSLRPAAVPAEATPCAPGALCPAGYSAASTSRAVKWEPVERAEGTPLVRTGVTVTLPLDLAWVDFLGEMKAAAAGACREGFRAAAAAGLAPEDLSRLHVKPQLTFPLKAAVFAGPQFAETAVTVSLNCWGGGFTAAEVTAATAAPR